MKNLIIRFLFAWAFALIAVSVSFSAPTSSIRWSMAPESFRRIAVLSGDFNRHLGTLVATNDGDSPALLSNVSIETHGLTQVRMDFAETYGGGASFNGNPVNLMRMSITIPAGESIRFNVRGDVSRNADFVHFNLVSFGGQYMVGSFPERMPAARPVVDDMPEPGIRNLSTRGFISPSQPMVMGFVVPVDDGEYQPYLIRAIGPSLRRFGVQNVVEDPHVNVFDSKQVSLAENDNWAAFNAFYAEQAGAFPLLSGSKDAAVLVWLPPGAYTVQVKAFGTGSGDVLLEAYALGKMLGKGMRIDE